MQHILDSTKDKSLALGTTYQKAKENELNLGLDLQGGMSVTMDVSLQGLLKSLSNNPKSPELLKAINTATSEKVNSEDNFITLFSNAFIKQNGTGKLAGLFAGRCKPAAFGPRPPDCSATNGHPGASQMRGVRAKR